MSIADGIQGMKTPDHVIEESTDCRDFDRIVGVRKHGTIRNRLLATLSYDYSDQERRGVLDRTNEILLVMSRRHLHAG